MECISTSSCRHPPRITLYPFLSFIWWDMNFTYWLAWRLYLNNPIWSWRLSLSDFQKSNDIHFLKIFKFRLDVLSPTWCDIDQWNSDYPSTLYVSFISTVCSLVWKVYLLQRVLRPMTYVSVKSSMLTFIPLHAAAIFDHFPLIHVVEAVTSPSLNEYPTSQE